MRLGRVCLLLVAGLTTGCQSSGGWPSSSDARHGQDLVLPLDVRSVLARVPANATFESLLKQQGLPASLVTNLVTSIRTVFNPRELRANQTYRITRGLDGNLREFRYDIDADRFLRAVSRPGLNLESITPGFEVSVETVPKEIAIDAVATTISREHPSLVGAFDASGENVQLALELAGVFGGEVDFNSDLQQGDRIEVLFERVKRNGEVAGYGNVQAAVLEAVGRRLTAIRFIGPDGKAGFYDELGRSLKRQFLRSPLPFEPRVTSRFSYRRLHPVHGGVRAHLGVDYGAPAGTPVMSVAAGVVEFAGWNGEAGRMVRIRHTGGYETSYLHLSAFGSGIRPGTKVEQGVVIGRVGMTGTATGPHLDYRIARNGVYVNPLTALSKTPPGDPIPNSALEEFARVRDAALADLRDRSRATR
jgi:murein DD-endopeptidase MepM/ murein hydrolase activator NlpD